MYKKIYKNMCFLAMLTLILSTVFILSASYTTLHENFKSDIKNEVILIADLLNNTEDSVGSLQVACEDIGNKRISLIGADGTVLYDNQSDISNMENHLDRPEVIEAEKSGFGESERYSASSDKTLYYYAVKLDNGSVLRLSTSSNGIRDMFIGIFIAVLIISVLIFVLAMIIARRLTENIVKPFEKIYSFDNKDIEETYEEIRPFLNRIARQNREIQRQMSKVKSQKVRLQAITDNINEGLVIIDANSNVLSVNNCALKIFEKAENDVKNRNLVYLTSLLEIHDIYKNALTGEKDNILLELNGKIYQIFYSPVYDHEAISGVVMLLFDVSEHAKAEQIRKEFTANVSHELKTPLTSIHGYAQIIRTGIAKPEDVAGFAEKIEKESSRLISLINDIIQLSILDENKADDTKQSISLKSVVLEAMESLQETAAKRNISISLHGDDTKVYGNASQLSELVYNLCENAIKYNKENGKVSITLKEKAFIVCDTGIGIPEEYLNRIFERFFRVDKSHSKQVNGTGLGLSIVKHIAEANNAVIKVKSKLGEGTEFTVVFK